MGRALYSGAVDLRRALAAVRLAAMLGKRLIPCLDVKGGRVVKGVRFVDLRDAGDPVEAAQAYDAQGADELVFLDIGASHEDRAIMLDVVRRTAEGIYMPLTVGGGDADARGHPHAAARGRRQGVAQHRGAGAARADLRGRARLRQPVHRGRHRRQARAAARAALGRLHPRRPPPAGRDAVDWAREVEALARARSCSPAWTATAPATATTSS